MTRDIYEPAVDEKIQIGEDIKMFSVKLDDEMMAVLPMKRVGNLGCAPPVGLLMIIHRLMITKSSSSMAASLLPMNRQYLSSRTKTLINSHWRRRAYARR